MLKGAGRKENKKVQKKKAKITPVSDETMLEVTGKKENKKTKKKAAKVVTAFDETILEAAEEVPVIDYEEKPKKRGRKKKEELGK
jgi:excinuclease ABC subunit A